MSRTNALNRPLRIAPYGTWRSPLTAARVTAGSLRFDHIVLDGDDVYWLEGRASEAGRSVIVRRTRDGNIRDVTPAGFNVRSRVHEYGGAPYTVDRGTIFFSNFTDQRLYRQVGDRDPQPLTADGFFYADAAVDEKRARLLCVREDHTRLDREPVNTIVAVSIAGEPERIIVSGADFYSDPIVSPDGGRLAWLQWNHPNMPWDGTELWVAGLGTDGLPIRTKRIAGGVDESIFQPEWSPDGDLYFVSDRTGWWNLYSAGASDAVAAIHPMAADFGKAQWTFSASTFACIDASRIIATYTDTGRWRMALIDTGARTFDPIALEIEPTDAIRADASSVYFVGGSPTAARAVIRMALADLECVVLRASTTDHIEADWISVPEAVAFASTGDQVYAFSYAPKNPEFTAPIAERPPLLVLSHGGPTDQALDVLDPRIQFWTSRGFAVLDVNYAGSSGFGRAYRDRLKGQWGIVDVADCVNGALHLVDAGKADPNRLMIRGGSAGGYTTLAALTFHNVFKAGASYYGISDIEVLARDTHKFESRYLDSLVGPYPAAQDIYIQRSPIHFSDRLSCPLILFQGLEDKVVPPNQAEMMADAVRRKGLPVAYVTFPGEQHGFRKEENIIRSLEAELYFYGAVLKFAISDPIDPVPIDNLR
jgi:dipeptidyl aminopeptidase/acylaminoacyl peptidase